MYLNTATGELTIKEGDIFNPRPKDADIENLIKKYDVDIKITNTGSKYLTIRDLDHGNINLVFLFYKDKLEWLSISLGKKYNFPEFVITEKEKIAVSNLLMSIGGENLYSWGSVRFNEDQKGGIISIIIKYTD